MAKTELEKTNFSSCRDYRRYLSHIVSFMYTTKEEAIVFLVLSSI